MSIPPSTPIKKIRLKGDVVKDDFGSRFLWGLTKGYVAVRVIRWIAGK